MENRALGWTLAELAQALGARLDGPADLRILRAGEATTDDPEALCFAGNEEFLRKAEQSGIGAVLVPEEAPPIEKPVLRVKDPRSTFARFLAMCNRPLPLEEGIHPTAVVSPSATLGEGVRVGPYAVIERDAVIGAGSRIYPFAYIGEGCRLGEKVTVFPSAVLYQDVEVGARTIIHASAIIGADGFGFIWDGQRRVKIPQVGKVVIGADAEIGACTTVDRAMMGTTRVGDGTKLDNLVMIGHNCVIGEHTVIASQVGLSGSTTIGDRVVMAGQAATSDHVAVCSDVVLGGRTGVTKNITKPGTYWGLPATPYYDAMRIASANRKLPDLVEKVKLLEKRLAELEEKA